MDFNVIRDQIDGIPHMDQVHGRTIYNHVRETRPELILELGTANGVSAAYMAAALDENGIGRIISLDTTRANFDPGPVKVLGDAGLDHLVELVRIDYSSYVWYLKKRIEEQSDQAGNCEPLYDFVFIDGGHDFTIDGLASTLSEKLLKPEGWLLLDDLDWTHSRSKLSTPLLPICEEERTTPNLRAVYELIIKQHPSFTEFREQDGDWGWAKKAPGQPRRLTLTMSEGPWRTVVRKSRSARDRLRRLRR